jgi:hypothetical protein
VALLRQALPLPGAPTAVLDALEAEIAARRLEGEAFAVPLAKALERAEPDAIAEILRWTLRRGAGAEVWLGRYLQQMFAQPWNDEAWRSLDRVVPPALRSEWVWLILAVARDPGLPDEAFRWGVEEVLLPLPEADRPRDPSWAGLYVNRTPSGLDLVKRLYATEYRALGVKTWLEQASDRGELGIEPSDRILVCERYAKMLRAGDPRRLAHTTLPAVPENERGVLLKQILGHMSGDRDDVLNCALDACRAAWPRAFVAGAPGLAGIAQALAGRLSSLRHDPSAWLGRLNAVLCRLGLDVASGEGFEADGLAASIVAETTRRRGADVEVWRLRHVLLHSDLAWRCLMLDIRRDLQDIPRSSRLEALERWDRHLSKGLHSARFFEVWLNACDGATLAAVVSARAADLRSLGELRWWEASRPPDARDDLRDALARLAPMAPLSPASLSAIRDWLGAELGPRPRASASGHEERIAARLSPLGFRRWQFIEILSKLQSTEFDVETCWRILADWSRGHSLDELELDDRYRVLAALIVRLAHAESFQIARLAKWLVEGGVVDVDRIGRWAEELEGVVAIPPEAHAARASMIDDIRVELKNVIRDSRERPAKLPVGDSP